MPRHYDKEREYLMSEEQLAARARNNRGAKALTQPLDFKDNTDDMEQLFVRSVNRYILSNYYRSVGSINFSIHKLAAEKLEFKHWLDKQESDSAYLLDLLKGFQGWDISYSNPVLTFRPKKVEV